MRENIREEYIKRPSITALKRQKKTRELKEIDIKPMIREISFAVNDGSLFIDLLADSGSASNLSPELVIASVTDRFGLGTDRSEVNVIRKKIIFDDEVWFA